MSAPRLPTPPCGLCCYSRNDRVQDTTTHSLLYRLATVVGLALLAFTVLVGGAGLYFGYRHEVQGMVDVQHQLVRTVHSQAEIAAFTGNAEIARDVLDGLVSIDTIASVKLTSTNGFVQEKSQPNANTSGTPTDYPLLSPVDRQTPIGTLSIVANQDVVRNLALRDAAGSTLMLILQILLTTIILGVAFRRVVGEPISQLASRMTRLQPGTNARLVLDAEHHDDEIGMLTLSANALLATAELALEHERDLRREIEKMEQYYRRIFDTTNVGIMVLHSSGRLINSNPILMKRVVGIHFDGKYTPDSENFINMIFDEPELAWSMVREAAARGRAVAADLRLRTADESVRWAHCILSVSKDLHGTIELIEGVLYDVTARRLQEEEARQRAEIDALTGIRNRHGCELFIDRALRHAREDNLFVGIMLIDLDGFKAVNDTLGHAAGDRVLVEVAQRLRDRIRRSTDLVGRLGGDEFVVLIYNCGEDRALLSQVASDIVTSLARPITLADNQSARIGASIGIACFPNDGLTRETAFARADEAMYAVKGRGKNSYGFAVSPGCAVTG